MKEPLVAYFFVGPGKAGTSWIYEFLRRRDLASVPALKEPYLLDMTPEDRRASIDRLYSRKDKMCDFSNTYSNDIANPAKIAAYNAEAKVIITVRLPSARIRSQFKYYQRTRLSNETLSEYLDRGDEIDMVKRSTYEPIILRYLQHFPRHQVLVLPLERLKTSPQQYSDTLCDFLGTTRVQLTPTDRLPVRQSSRARSRLASTVAKTLADRLRDRGMYRTLACLKSSRIVNRALFNPERAAESDDFGCYGQVVRNLDAQYARIVATYC